MDSKVCTKCKEDKPLAEYYKKKKGKYGVDSTCKTCEKQRRKSYYEENKEHTLQQAKEWHESNRESETARMKKYRKENRGAVLNAQKAWRDKNPAVMAHHDSKRRSARLQRTPSWANDQLIAAYYMEAKRLEELTGIKFHVDHIIPLQGELVSGLHVETNLQLLPAHENMGKSNSFDPELFVD